MVALPIFKIVPVLVNAPDNLTLPVDNILPKSASPQIVNLFLPVISPEDTIPLTESRIPLNDISPEDVTFPEDTIPLAKYPVFLTNKFPLIISSCLINAPLTVRSPLTKRLSCIFVSPDISAVPKILTLSSTKISPEDIIGTAKSALVLSTSTKTSFP